MFYTVFEYVPGAPLTFRRRNILDNVDAKQTPHGVFMKVGELHRGIWFVG